MCVICFLFYTRVLHPCKKAYHLLKEIEKIASFKSAVEKATLKKHIVSLYFKCILLKRFQFYECVHHA
jgi:hypothetical protein